MTTIITRVFPDKDAAMSAEDRLRFKGVPGRQMDVFSGADVSKARLERAGVDSSAISAYSSALAAGKAIFVARTTYQPLGAAQLVRDLLEQKGGVETKGANEDFFVASTPDMSPSILKDHPHFLTVKGAIQPQGTLTSIFGIPMVKQKDGRRTLIAHDRRMSRMFWPMKLVSRKSRSSSVFHGGRHMSRGFWPMPLLSKGTRSKSAIPGGALPFSRLFGLRTTM